jgi:hypothetical protein
MYTTWKWSIGEPYYKSERLQKNETLKEEEYDTRTNAINQSLSDDPFLNQDTALNISDTMFSRNQNTNETRREDLDSKISDREMIAQRGFNPFLQTSYVNDVVVRDMFLKPVNTTFERTKENSEDSA